MRRCALELPGTVIQSTANKSMAAVELGSMTISFKLALRPFVALLSLDSGGSSALDTGVARVVSITSCAKGMESGRGGLEGLLT